MKPEQPADYPGLINPIPGRSDWKTWRIWGRSWYADALQYLFSCLAAGHNHTREALQITRANCRPKRIHSMIRSDAVRLLSWRLCIFVLIHVSLRHTLVLIVLFRAPKASVIRRGDFFFARSYGHLFQKARIFAKSKYSPLQNRGIQCLKERSGSDSQCIQLLLAPDDNCVGYESFEYSRWISQGAGIVCISHLSSDSHAIPTGER